ncbi:MAG: DUF1549 domain-containing protein, partial [Planctomycetales bacterium]|nr:DUF1549 domain-containing protein [Planctomycetales bacterium]
GRHDSPLGDPLFGAARRRAAAPQSAVPWTLPYAIEPQTDVRIIRFVDERLEQSWLAAGVARAEPADDDQWCRRVYRQLLGRDPSSEELVDFATDAAADKRDALVGQLLADNTSRHEYARHWSERWTALLVGEEGDAAPVDRRQLANYLEDLLRANQPLDVWAKELIAAAGSTQPEAEDFNPAVNFLLASLPSGHADAATAVGRVFLGHQAQCARCHDEPPGADVSQRRSSEQPGWSQQEFWQLTAFFKQASAGGGSAAPLRLTNVDFVGKSGNPDEAELYFTRLDGQRRIAYPVFLHGERISPSGRVADVDRRSELAALIVGSEEFSRAVVNHLWRELLGRELAPPVAHNGPAPTANRELLERLAEQFAASGFDHERLVKWIVLCEANAHESKEPLDLHDAPLLAHGALFERCQFPQDESGSYYDSVAGALRDVVAKGRPISLAQSPLFARVSPQRPGAGAAAIFVEDAGGDASLEPFVQRMIASEMPVADKVEHLFQFALARAPTSAEMAAANALLAHHRGDLAVALDDIWWGLSHSREFTAGR